MIRSFCVVLWSRIGSSSGIILCMPSQWKATLYCNVVIHWLGAHTNDPSFISKMGQVMKSCLSCYLVLLSFDSRNQVTRQVHLRDLTHMRMVLSCHIFLCHYNDIIMSAMASQFTSLTIVYSIVCSRRRSKKASKLCVTGLCAGNSPVTGEFPAQRASNAEDDSVWWSHHVFVLVLDPCDMNIWGIL